METTTPVVKVRTSFSILLAAMLLLLAPGISSAQSKTSSQSAKPAAGKATTPSLLSPQEKEAQMHYRVALEAIKNNDFGMASDELKTASELAPKNGLIWYNLAVVDSHIGDSKAGLDHIEKAISLGLPKTMQDDADQLEAKLTYESKREANRALFSAKLLELGKVAGSAFGCYTEASGDNGTGKLDWSCGLQIQDGSPQIIVHFNLESLFYWSGFSHQKRVTSAGEITINLADLSPDPDVVTYDMGCPDNSITSPGRPAPHTRYTVVLKGKSPTAIHFAGKIVEDESRNFQIANHTETPWANGSDFGIDYPDQERAEGARKAFAEIIRLSGEIN